MDVSGGRAERFGVLLSSRDLERRDTGSEPHGAGGETANDVAEEVQPQVQTAVPDGDDEYRPKRDRQRAPESGPR